MKKKKGEKTTSQMGIFLAKQEMSPWRVKERGITLIALVITVIVLLILAGVAISMTLNEGNIFEKANEAKTSWNAKVEEEENEVNNALEYIEQYVEGEGYGLRSDGKFYCKPNTPNEEEWQYRIYTGLVYDSEHFSYDNNGLDFGWYVGPVYYVWDDDYALDWDMFTPDGIFLGPNWAD